MKINYMYVMYVQKWKKTLVGSNLEYLILRMRYISVIHNSNYFSCQMITYGDTNICIQLFFVCQHHNHFTFFTSRLFHLNIHGTQRKHFQNMFTTYRINLRISLIFLLYLTPIHRRDFEVPSLSPMYVIMEQPSHYLLSTHL